MSTERKAREFWIFEYDGGIMVRTEPFGASHLKEQPIHVREVTKHDGVWVSRKDWDGIINTLELSENANDTAWKIIQRLEIEHVLKALEIAVGALNKYKSQPDPDFTAYNTGGVTYATISFPAAQALTAIAAELVK